MPYIPKEDRVELDEYIDNLLLPVSPIKPGELNYIITKILLKTEPKRYADFNALIGVMESVKLELYRRVIAPYEEKKKDEQGDVYL